MNDVADKIESLGRQFDEWKREWIPARESPFTSEARLLELMEQGKALVTEALDLVTPFLDHLSPEMRQQTEFLMSELVLLNNTE